MARTDPRSRVKAGDIIVWRQYSEPGSGWREPYYRAGTVWSQAPVGNGLRSAWWVIPDQPEPGEVTAWGCIAVGDAAGDWRGWVDGKPALLPHRPGQGLSGMPPPGGGSSLPR